MAKMEMLQPLERRLKAPLIVAVKKILCSLLVPLLLLSALSPSEIAWSVSSPADP